jgi:hypothetical protein
MRQAGRTNTLQLSAGELDLAAAKLEEQLIVIFPIAG